MTAPSVRQFAVRQSQKSGGLTDRQKEPIWKRIFSFLRLAAAPRTDRGQAAGITQSDLLSFQGPGRLGITFS